MDWRFGYFKPNAGYAALVNRLVTSGTTWLDIGCGRFLFPSFPKLAARLAARASRIVGVDPDETIRENPYLHEAHECRLEDFEPDTRFDLITMRMVAEHITDPESVVRRIRGMLAPGGRLVIYTVHRWGLFTMVTGIVPDALHHPIKRVLWRTEAKDTFPVALKMNTRAALRRLAEANGLTEEFFTLWDDCNAFGRWRPTRWMELTARRVLRGLGLRYPEANILAVYRAG
jgi:SAM-dependent methyltransferase